MAAGYVANWGNDLNDGLSWATAKKSLQGAVDAGLNPRYVKGYYDEVISTGDAFNIYSKGSKFYYSQDVAYTLSNMDSNCDMTVKTDTITALIITKSINSFYNSNALSTNLRIAGRTFTQNVVNCLAANIGYNGHIPQMINCTIKTSNDIVSCNLDPINKNNIFVTSQIYKKSKNFDFKYTLFIGSSFKFVGGGLGTDETTYEYPIGVTDTEKLQNLRSRMAIVYGGVASDYLIGCAYYSGSYNDIFADADNDNFFLKNTPNNPAIHMSYDGKFIGARPPAAGTFAIADATKINIDANGNIVDQAINASATFNTINDIGRIVEITNLEALANIAYRNGLSINSGVYVGSDINAGANVLTNGKQYQVIDAAGTGGTIVLDDAGATIMSAFDTFTAVDEGSGAGLGFSSVDGLTVREIDISKYDERIEVTSSQTDASLATATTIKLLLREPPLVNVDGSGEPTYGNADDLFDVGTAVPWKARYVKINVAIKAAQLYAR